MGCLSYRASAGFALLGWQSSCCSWVQLQAGIWAMPHLTGEGEALNRALQRLLIALGHSAGELSAVCSWWLSLQTARDIFLGSDHSLCSSALHNFRGSQSPTRAANSVFGLLLFSSPSSSVHQCSWLRAMPEECISLYLSSSSQQRNG